MKITRAAFLITLAFGFSSAIAADSVNQPTERKSVKKPVKPVKQSAPIPTDDALSPESTEKTTEIRELILLFEGMNNSGRRFVQQILLNMFRQKNQVTQDQQALLVREADQYTGGKPTKEFNDPLLEIYDKHYTASEIHDLLTFYRSPTGRKSLTISGQIGRDSISHAQHYAQTIYPEFETRALKLIQ